MKLKKKKAPSITMKTKPTKFDKKAKAAMGKVLNSPDPLHEELTRVKSELEKAMDIIDRQAEQIIQTGKIYDEAEAKRVAANNQVVHLDASLNRCTLLCYEKDRILANQVAEINRLLALTQQRMPHVDAEMFCLTKRSDGTLAAFGLPDEFDFLICEIYSKRSAYEIASDNLKDPLKREAASDAIGAAGRNNNLPLLSKLKDRLIDILVEQEQQSKGKM